MSEVHAEAPGGDLMSMVTGVEWTGPSDEEVEAVVARLEGLRAAVRSAARSSDQKDLVTDASEDDEFAQQLAEVDESAWRGAMQKLRNVHGCGKIVDDWKKRIALKQRRLKLELDGRPVVRLGSNLHHLVSRLEEVVAEHPDGYRGAGGFVTVGPHPESEHLVATPASPDRLRVLVSERVLLVDEDEYEVEPPVSTCRALHDWAQWPSARPLKGIVHEPMLREDGGIVQTDGYDEESGYLVDLDGEYPPVPESPSKEQARAAAERLLHVICDFPADEAGQSAWLAGLLSVVGRTAYDGPSPLIVVEANTRGAGKSKMLTALGTIATGRQPALGPAPSGLGADDELRKRITAWVMAGTRLAVLDNVVGPLGWPSLDAVLTAGRHGDRVLGASRDIDAEVRTVFAATANNVEYAADVVRRTLPIRLVTPYDAPEDRPVSDFVHPNLDEWIREHRQQLLVDALTILRGYYSAGRPDQDLKPWGSYERWSALVRGAIVWCGLTDPIEARGGIADRDEEATLLGRLLEGLSQLYGEDEAFTARDLLIDVMQCGGCGHGPHDGRTCSEVPCGCHEYRPDARLDDLRDALEELSGSRPGGLSTRSLGRHLKKLKDRYAGGRCIQAFVYQGTNRYRLARSEASSS